MDNGKKWIDEINSVYDDQIKYSLAYLLDKIEYFNVNYWTKIQDTHKNMAKAFSDIDACGPMSKMGKWIRKRLIEAGDGNDSCNVLEGRDMEALINEIYKDKEVKG